MIAAILLVHSYVLLVGYCTSIVVLGVLIAPRTQIRIRGILLLLCFGMVVAGTRMLFVEDQIPTPFSDEFNIPGSLVGTVITLPDLRETSTRLTVHLKRGEDITNIIASVPLYPKINVGDSIKIQGTLKKPEPFETDGGRTFQYDAFLRKDGIFGVIQPAFAEVIGHSNHPWLRFLRILQSIKDTLMKLLATALPEPESSLAAGLIVGGKQGLGERLITDFTKAGMLQIIVLSGYNVMIVATILMRLLSSFPKNISFMVGITSILCFVLIAGAGSSALRAGLMAFFSITASTFGKRYDVLRVLFVSLFLLGLWNPLMLIYDPGFQFSFIATLGLILLVPILTPCLLFLRNTTLIELTATTLAAEIMLLPLLLWQTGNLSLVSVFANVVAMPAVPAAMGFSVLAGMLAFPFEHIAPGLSVIAGLPAYIPLTYIIKVATLSASLPFAQITIPAFSFWVVVVSYSVIGVLIYRFSTLPHRGNDFLQPASLGFQEMPLRTSSCPLACSQPCRHVPKDPPQA